MTSPRIRTSRFPARVEKRGPVMRQLRVQRAALAYKVWRARQEPKEQPERGVPQDLAELEEQPAQPPEVLDLQARRPGHPVLREHPRLPRSECQRWAP